MVNNFINNLFAILKGIFVFSWGVAITFMMILPVVLSMPPNGSAWWFLVFPVTTAISATMSQGLMKYCKKNNITLDPPHSGIGNP